jgi:Flp pilus assembly protein TadG
MRRLTSTLKAHWHHEHGAVAVLFAVSLVVLIGATAFTVDFGTMHLQRRQHQNSADAGALAIAQDCGRGQCPGNADARATEYTASNEAANADPGNFGASISEAEFPTAGTVRVTVSGDNEPIFRGVLQQADREISATATAVWGTPSSLVSIIPIAFSICEYEYLAGVDVNGVPQNLAEPPFPPYPNLSLEREFRIKSSNWEAAGIPCDRGPAAHIAPGSWGWLEPNSTNPCRVSTEVGTRVRGDTGNNAVCKNDWDSYLGQVVYIPIYGKACRNQFGTCDEDPKGSNIWFEIEGYVGFYLSGFGAPSIGQKGSIIPGSTLSCKGGAGQDPCLLGFFTSGLIPADQLPPGAIIPGDMSGAVAVQLTE